MIAPVEKPVFFVVRIEFFRRINPQRITLSRAVFIPGKKNGGGLMTLESFNILKELDGKKTHGTLCEFAVRLCLPVRRGKDFGNALDLIFCFF